MKATPSDIFPFGESDIFPLEMRYIAYAMRYSLRELWYRFAIEYNLPPNSYGNLGVPSHFRRKYIAGAANIAGRKDYITDLQSKSISL